MDSCKRNTLKYKELVVFLLLGLLKLNLVGHHHITCAMYFQFHIFAHDKGWAFFQLRCLTFTGA